MTAARGRESRRSANGRTPGGRGTEPLRIRVISAEGRAGSVRFDLQRVAGGLYVEREDIPKRGLRNIQSVAFSDAASFQRWCDADPVRFEHPLLHDQLKRAGHELIGSEPSANSA